MCEELQARLSKLQTLVSEQDAKIKTLQQQNKPAHACYECRRSYVQEQLNWVILLRSMLKPIPTTSRHKHVNALAQSVTQLQTKLFEKLVQSDLLKHDIIRSKLGIKEDRLKEFILQLEDLREDTIHLQQEWNRLIHLQEEDKTTEDHISTLCKQNLEECQAFLTKLQLQDKDNLELVTTR